MKRADDDASHSGNRSSTVRGRAGADGTVPSRTLSPEARFAIYLTPSEAWQIVGNLWLGRDAERDQWLPRDWLALLPGRADDADIDADADRTALSASLIDTWTADPRRYGLHATLKPPFRLAIGQTAAALDAALRSLAGAMTPFDLPLRLDALRGFLAWLPADDAVARGPLQSLADTCVRELDGFRAPPTAHERARRLHKGDGQRQLSDREQAHLARWAYPYVFDTFRFHITLTNRLDAATEKRARRALAALASWAATVEGRDVGAQYAAGSEATMRGDARMPVRDISLSVQPGPDLPFVVARHYGFDGSIRDGAGAWALCGSAVAAETAARSSR